MPSSTSRHGWSDRRQRLLAFAGLLGAPLVWLAALQTGYVLAYQACDDRTTSWVIVPTAAAIGLAALITTIAIRAQRRATGQPEPQPLITRLGTGIALLMLIVLVASLIPTVILHPCD